MSIKQMMVILKFMRVNGDALHTNCQIIARNFEYKIRGNMMVLVKHSQI